VAVIVENGGYGSAQAAPIASFIVEKYLNDTLRNERLADVNRIAGQNLMPKYLVRLQFKADSSRAADWARLTGDSTRIMKYLDHANRALLLDTSEGSKNPLLQNIRRMPGYKPLMPRLAPTVVSATAAAPRPDSGRRAPALPDSPAAHRRPDTPVVHRRPDTGDSRKPSTTIKKPSDQKGDSTQP
jgi:hypothetical protein